MFTRRACAALLVALTVAPLALPRIAAAQSAPDEEAIKALVQSAYVDGLQNLGDLEKTRAGFHPDFVLLGLRDGQLTRLPIADWIASAEKRKAGGQKPPLTTCRCGTLPAWSAWSFGTCMIRSSTPDSTSAIWVWRSGMKRMRTLPIFACGRGESLK